MVHITLRPLRLSEVQKRKKEDEERRRKKIEETTWQKYNGLPYSIETGQPLRQKQSTFVIRFEAMLQPNIGFNLERTLTVFTRSDITSGGATPGRASSNDLDEK